MKEVLMKGENLSKIGIQAGKKRAILNEINFTLYQNDFTVIMGSSGAGKSTFLYTLSGMDAPSEGNVYYKEKEVSHLSENQKAKLRAKEFGFIFQQTHLVSNLTLLENVLVAGLVSRCGSEEEIKERAELLLKKMNVEKVKNHLPFQVSGGEAQRAAIARAVVGKPCILFADEPTGALNKASTEEVLDLLTALNQQGQTILMVTHDLYGAVRANRILYLEDGKIIEELNLSPYTKEEEKKRYERIHQWLTAFRW